MRKIYSIVLMAAALLIGTNAWATDTTVDGNDLTALQNAIDATGTDGGKVTLTQDIIITAPNQTSTSTKATATIAWAGIWIGSEAENGTAKSITLDLAGHNITFKTGTCVNAKSVQIGQTLLPFVITKGKLEVTSDSEAHIYVQKSATGSDMTSATSVFSVFGTFNRVDPKGNNPFSHLVIGENVMVETQNGTGIIVDYVIPTQAAIAAVNTVLGKTLNYRTDYYQTKPNAKGKTSARGLAFGALVEVKGQLISQGGTKCYGIKTNGVLACPGDTALDVSGNVSISPEISAADRKYAPFVHVYSTAKLESDKNYLADGCAAAYASGYAQWKIEGACEGATGLYASSGNIAIEGDATITSTSPTHVEPTDAGHANGAGSAIVVNSRDAYAGAMDVTISGDPTITSTTGYALEESVKTSNDSTKVENITINGGTFQGGTDPVTHEDKPAIIVSNTTATNETTEVVVYGGNVVNGAEVGQTGTLDDLIPTTVHTTTMEVDGKQVTVVSEGAAPVAANSVIAATPNTSVKWQNTTTKEETLNEDLNLAELEINETYAQKLTIAEGKTLNVGRVVLGPNAQIIVEAGGKLIVTGEQGFVAPKIDNIVLQANEAQRAILLFHPDVTSNRHPSATVEFFSKSFVDGSNYASQRFGIPTFGELTSVDAVNSTDESVKVRTRFYNFNKDANSWVSLGYINGAGSDPAFDKTQMADPFAYYQMYNYATTANTKVIMKGQLFGNESPDLAVRGNFWNGFANSYMGPINIEKLLGMIPDAVDKAIYLYDITASQATWEPINLVLIEETDAIQPMQPFLVRNANEANAIAVNYADAVYYTASGSGESKPGAAPARRAVNNMTKAKLIVKGENCTDRVIVAEDDQFSAEFDNGYDAAKFMNEGINMYVSADEKMSIFATDDLNNTYVGFKAINGGNYTIEFAKVQGEELFLIDHETGAQVAMVEGNTYEFTAAANSTNDYRFEIVEPAKLPTAIENAEAVKSAKGIYTITGQYVGEMSVWNTLPAGIYVVNGEKLVK